MNVSYDWWDDRLFVDEIILIFVVNSCTVVSVPAIFIYPKGWLSFWLFYDAVWYFEVVSLVASSMCVCDKNVASGTNSEAAHSSHSLSSTFVYTLIFILYYIYLLFEFNLLYYHNDTTIIYLADYIYHNIINSFEVDRLNMNRTSWKKHCEHIINTEFIGLIACKMIGTCDFKIYIIFFIWIILVKI